MPPKAMTTEMIEFERTKILDCALELIDELGYDSVTMRTIAKRLNFSATKIYKYFHNKDEILISIAIASFNLISEITNTKLCTAKNPQEKLLAFVESYIDFAIEYKHNYEIIFGDNAPTHRYYTGTELEVIAKEQHVAGTNFLNTLNTVIFEMIEFNNYEAKLPISSYSVNLLCILHGSVCFHNNNLLSEVFEDEEVFRELTMDRIVNRFNEVVM